MQGVVSGGLQEKKREGRPVPSCANVGMRRSLGRRTWPDLAGTLVRSGALAVTDGHAFGRPAITKSVNIRRWISKATAP
jgi:hypothetical protein